MIINKEQKEILDKFNDLLPWDKGEILKYIVHHSMSEDEIEEYFIKGTGYVKYDELDLVKEVIDNDLETEVLDEMSDYDIVEYLSSSYNARDNAKDLFMSIDSDDQADIIDDFTDSQLKDFVKSLKEKYANTVNLLLKYLLSDEKIEELKLKLD